MAPRAARSHFIGRTAVAAVVVGASFSLGASACSIDSAGLADDSTLLDGGGGGLDSSFVDTASPDAGEPDLGFDAVADTFDSAVDPDVSPIDAPVDMPDAALACDPIRELPFGGHCYWLVTSSQSFIDARHGCDATAGGHLVTIDTYDEDTFVGSMTIGLEVWMGLVRDPTANPKLRASFKWITGAPMLVDAWRGSEPDGSGECARHTATGWADSGCAESFASICERE